MKQHSGLFHLFSLPAIKRALAADVKVINHQVMYRNVLQTA